MEVETILLLVDSGDNSGTGENGLGSEAIGAYGWVGDKLWAAWGYGGENRDALLVGIVLALLLVQVER